MTNVRRRSFAVAIAVVLVATAVFCRLDRAGAAGARSTDVMPIGAPATPCANNSVAAGAAQALHHAGLVIVFPEGRIETRCVTFAEDEISGLELLRRSELPLVLSSYGGTGAAVCRIDDVGCSDPGTCFCQCTGANCMFWTYFTLQDSGWRFQNIGAGLRQLHDGDADGWVWGSGHTSPQGARPPCPTSTATAAPLATATPAIGATAGQPNAPQAIATQARETSTATPQQAKVTLAPQVIAQATSSSGPSTSRTTASGNGSEDGLPVGLIAFGAVAGALVVVGGGVALRRRWHG